MQKILLLEDNSLDADLVGREITSRWPKVKLITVSRLAEARKVMQENGSVDIALFDLNLPDGNAMDLLSELRERNCEIPIIIFTGDGTEEIATTALKTGANDYIPKTAGFHKKIVAQIEFTFNQSLSNRQHLSVLYVEHNKADVDLTRHYLKKYAPYIHLTIVQNGEEILKLLPESGESLSNFDILLLDYNLPGLNAIEIGKVIRQERKLSIAIVIVTGQGDENIAVEALKIGIDDYIVKNKDYLLRLPSVLTSSFRRRELERQRLELKQSEVKLLEAQHIAKIGRWELDLKTNNLNWAPTIFDIFEIDPEKFGASYEAFLETIHPDDRDKVDFTFQESLKNKTPYEITHRLLMKDGRIKYVNEKGHSDFDQEGNSIRSVGIVQDITEIKQAEAKLQESETKYRLLADYASDWEYWMNPQGEYIYISPACEKTSGYPPEAFEKNKNLLEEIALPEYQELIKGHADDDIKELHKPLEFQILTADGKIKWISHFCQPVYDDDNNYAGKRGVNRDITVLKISEIELRQSEERFRRLFDDLGDAVYVTITGGADMGKILEANPAAVKQSGYSKNELLQMNIINDLYAGETGDVNLDEWDEKIRKGENVLTTERKKRKDGSEFWTEVIVTPIEFKGKRAGLSINRDITERKRAEKVQEVILNISNATQMAGDLQETMIIIQKELGSLMDTENFFVALYDKETDRIHLPYYQDEKDDIADFPAGKTLTGLVIKEGKPLLIDSAASKKLEEEDKIERVGFDSEIWLGVPLRTKGNITGAFVVQSYTDPNAYSEKDKEVLEIVSHQISISIERKRDEEKLIAALEAAKESDRVKTAFLANMSHELRTPLNAVIGFSSLIDEQSDPRDSENFAKLILKSGNNLLAIVDDIFEITLLEQDNVDIKRSKMPISSFLSDIFQTILHRQKNMEATEVSIEQDIKRIEPLTNANTDFDKLRQVFLSILGNSLKFTHEGSIRFGVYPSEDGNDFVFFVKDTGIGIAKEKHANIFERFKIGDESLTRKYAGIGLGLFISEKLVRALGGKIWLESEEGVGSTFFFTIPR